MGYRYGWGATYLITAAALWGGSQVISKAIMQEIQPMTLTFVRFASAAAVLGVVVLWKGSLRIERKDVWRFAGLGFLGYTVSIGSQLLGLQLTNAHVGTMITSPPPIFMLLFAAVLFREKVTMQKLAALVSAGVGVFLMTGIDHRGHGELLGILLLVAAAAAWALYAVCSMSMIRKYDAITTTFWSLCFGALFTVPFCSREFVSEGLALPVRLDVWLGIGYVGVIATAVGFCLWNRGIELWDSSAAGLFLFVQPLFGSLLAAVFLHERIRPVFYFSSTFIIVGIGLSLIDGRRLGEWNFGKGFR